MPLLKPLDVVIEADDEVSECGKVASQIDDLFIIQVRDCYAAQCLVMRCPVRRTQSSAD